VRRIRYVNWRKIQGAVDDATGFIKTKMASATGASGFIVCSRANGRTLYSLNSNQFDSLSGFTSLHKLGEPKYCSAFDGRYVKESAFCEWVGLPTTSLCPLHECHVKLLEGFLI
jgi:hypothetical protein